MPWAPSHMAGLYVSRLTTWLPRCFQRVQPRSKGCLWPNQLLRGPDHRAGSGGLVSPGGTPGRPRWVQAQNNQLDPRHAGAKAQSKHRAQQCPFVKLSRKGICQLYQVPPLSRHFHQKRVFVYNKLLLPGGKSFLAVISAIGNFWCPLMDLPWLYG